MVKQLTEVSRAFHDALQAGDPQQVSYDQVTAAENLAQEGLSQLVVLIAAKYRKNDAASVERRNRLLAPVLEQDTRIAEARRRRRSIADVDPETGEDQDIVSNDQGVVSNDQGVVSNDQPTA